MPTATEILSKIFDKDGIKYKKTDDRIRIDSMDCSISIEGHGMGYEITSTCMTETDKDIRQLFGNLKIINRFDIARMSPDGLLIKGVESPMGKDIGFLSFTATTGRKIPHPQNANINCKYTECGLTKGAGWED